MWLAIARILAAFNISKPKDAQGRDIEQAIRFIPQFTRYVAIVPFVVMRPHCFCVISVTRSPMSASLHRGQTMPRVSSIKHTTIPTKQLTPTFPAQTRLKASRGERSSPNVRLRKPTVQYIVMYFRGDRPPTRSVSLEGELIQTVKYSSYTDAIAEGAADWRTVFSMNRVLQKTRSVKREGKVESCSPVARKFRMTLQYSMVCIARRTLYPREMRG